MTKMEAAGTATVVLGIFSLFAFIMIDAYNLNEELYNSRKKVEEMAIPIFTEVSIQDRIYEYPDCKIEVKGVISINVSKSGTHRLNTNDGKKHIIPPGWRHIEFEAKEWTF